MLGRISIVCFLALLGVPHVTGQTAVQPPPPSDDAISTDRPAVAESSVVVPKGSLQLENGFLFSSGQGQSSFDAPETAVRFGLSATTEVRFSIPDFYRVDVPGSDTYSGFGDAALGLKQQLGPARGFDVSFIVFLSMPTGSRAFSSHGYDPGLQLPWSRKISDNWTAAGQFATYWPTQGDRRNVTGEGTLLMDRQLTKPMDAFIEYAGDFPERGGPRHLLHFGVAFKASPRQQLDVHYGIGLSAAAVNHYIGAGYSFRFQAVRR